MSTRTLPPTLPAAPVRDLRPALLPGLALIVAGAVQGDGALVTSAHRGASAVSQDQLSFPWAGSTAVTTSAIWGATQVLIVLGLVAFARSGAAPTRAGRVGARLAVAGAVSYVVGHALSLVSPDAAVDDPVAVAVIAAFAVGTLVTAAGLVVAGIVTLRSSMWSGWRRATPLALGVWMVVMLPLQFTAALPLAVGVYALAVMALGWALVVEVLGAPTTEAVSPPA